MASLREIQLCELDIVTEIDRICKKNNIKYWLAYGSMLGAVRHNGFIPWDDDMDIYILQSDFAKFVKCCKYELNQNYYLQLPIKDNTVPWMFYKMRKNGTIMLQPGQVDNGNAHYGVWVDIFPLVNAANSKEMREQQFQLLCKLQTLRGQHWPLNQMNILKKVIFYFHECLLCRYEKHMFKKVLKLGEQSDDYLVIGNSYYNVHTNKDFEKNIFPKVMFNITKEYKFEKKCLLGIEDYDSYLSSVYGKDYMTPKKFNQHINNYDDVIV